MAPVLLPPDAVPGASAQGSLEQWFGPAEFGRVDAGWNIRVPLTVKNDFGFKITNPEVRVEMDFADILTRAGWPGIVRESRAQIQSFTLDAASIRVVEYTGTAMKEFAPAKPDPQRFEVPSRFDPLFYEAKQRAAFDPQANPVGTVSFVVPGTMDPGAERRFMVYLDAKENNVKAPADYRTFRSNPQSFDTRRYQGLIESAFWIGRGTEFHGYDPGSQGASRLHVIGLYAGTTVTVSTYTRAGSLAVDEKKGIENPFDVAPNAVVSYPIGTGILFKVTATRPVIAALEGNTRVQPAGLVYYPGTDGRLLASQFMILPFHQDLFLVNPQPSRTLSITVTGPTPPSQQVTLTGEWARVGGIDPGGRQPYTLVSTDGSPFLVTSLGASGTFDFRASVPSVTGSPIGELFYAPLPTSGSTPGFVMWSPDASGAARVSDGTRLIEPATGPLKQPIAAGAGSPWVAFMDAGALPPGLLFWESCRVSPATESCDAQGGRPPENLSLVAGAALTHLAAPIGGAYGERVNVEGPVFVFGLFNDTFVNVTAYGRTDGKVRSFQDLFLGRDEVRPAPGEQSILGSTDRLRINATKPVVVFPRIPSTCGSGVCNYAGYLAGRMPSVPYTLGAGDIRGYLVDLASRDLPTEPVVKTVPPNGTVVYKLRVTNQGRWIGGANLVDTIRVNATPAPDWTVVLDQENFRLDSFQSADFTMSVTPPPTAGVGTRQGVTLTATSLSNPNMKDSLRTLTLVVANFDVGLWLFQENGPKSEERSLEAADETTFELVIKNLGSVRDRFSITAGPPGPGWAGALLDKASNPLPPRIELDPGATERFKYRVTAPPPGSSSINTVEVLATSLSSAQASSRVLLTTRINPNATLALSTAEPALKGTPGRPLDFNVSLTNRGDSFVSIRFNLTSALPPGWGAPELFLVTERGESKIPGDQLDGVPPTTEEKPLNLVVRTAVPPGARAEEVGQMLLFAEVVVLGRAGSSDFLNLTAGVRSIHNLTFDAPDLIDLEPGASEGVPVVLANLGNGREDVRFRLASAAAGLEAALPEALQVVPGEERPVELRFSLAPGFPAGLYRVVVNATFSDNSETSLPLDITVKRIRRAEVAGLSDVETSPGRPATVDLVVRNTGNANETFTLLADAGAGVQAVFEPEQVVVAPNASADVRLVVTPGAGLPEGSRPVRISVKADNGDEAGTAAAELHVRKPDLAVTRVESGGLRGLSRGDLFTVAVEVSNRGNTAARDVSVQLRSGGSPVDNVTIALLQPEKSVVATLKWIVEDPGSSLTVVVDPENAVQELDETNNEAEVRGDETPGPGAALVVAAMALALAVGGRGVGTTGGKRRR